MIVLVNAFLLRAKTGQKCLTGRRRQSSTNLVYRTARCRSDGGSEQVAVHNLDLRQIVGSGNECGGRCNGRDRVG